MLPTRYASFLKRFVAFIIDGILAKLVALVIVIPLGLLTAGTGILTVVSLRNSDQFFCNGDFGEIFEALAASLSVVGIVFWIFIGVMIVWLYFAVFESSPRQATPGKMMLGMFVTDIHGQRLSFPRALGRTLSKILSKMFCFLGYILALFTARNQTLHDMIAGTLVLEADYPAPMAAPPLATSPGTSPAPDLASVAVPTEEPPGSHPVLDKPQGQDTDSDSTDNKQDEKTSGKNKPEQENE
jgi:uncharacterized RDD family membrane protein YckC